MNRMFTLAFALIATACTDIAFLQGRGSPEKPLLDRHAGELEINQLSRNRLSLIRSFGFEEGGVCVRPFPIAEPTLDSHRSLFVHDAATLGAGDFSLQRTLQKLAGDVAATVPGVTPQSIFRQLWDTQNDAASAATPTNAHCSDADGKIGAYPLNKCPRPEGQEAQGTDADIAARMASYQPIGLVNRLDLAGAGWRNCGEHRIVYGKTDGGFAKNFIIFEAVLPNPKPGCRSGCRDVVEFWVDLSSDPSPASRAAKLETFFYRGLPGFAPVVHTNHYSSGSGTVYGGSGGGQIRTNQFLSSLTSTGPWTLKEFKTLISCSGGACDYDLLPINVKTNPYGVLWSKDVANGGPPSPVPDNLFATPIAGLAVLAAAFQNEVLAQVAPDRLANPDLNSITYEVKLDKNAAESQSQSPTIDHYREQFSGSADATFRTSLNAEGGAFGLSGEQIVNRALANSCAGCHLPIGFDLTAPNAIGPGLSWPSALRFVHNDVEPRAFGPVDGFDPAQFGGNAIAFDISPALLTTFLPARRTTLATSANARICDCVRKPGPLPPDRLPRFREIVSKSNADVRAQLDDVRKATLAKSKVGAEDAARFVLQSKAVLSKAEAARNAELRQLGVAFADGEPARATPVVLAQQRLAGAALAAAKAGAMQKIVTAEPPRQSVTGSFRAH